MIGLKFIFCEFLLPSPLVQVKSKAHQVQTLSNSAHYQAKISESQGASHAQHAHTRCNVKIPPQHSKSMSVVYSIHPLCVTPREKVGESKALRAVGCAYGIVAKLTNHCD
jgi:hypothetical protein